MAQIRCLLCGMEVRVPPPPPPSVRSKSSPAEDESIIIDYGYLLEHIRWEVGYKPIFCGAGRMCDISWPSERLFEFHHRAKHPNQRQVIIDKSDDFLSSQCNILLKLAFPGAFAADTPSSTSDDENLARFIQSPDSDLFLERLNEWRSQNNNGSTTIYRRPLHSDHSANRHSGANGDAAALQQSVVPITDRSLVAIPIADRSSEQIPIADQSSESNQGDVSSESIPMDQSSESNRGDVSSESIPIADHSSEANRGDVSSESIPMDQSSESKQSDVSSESIPMDRSSESISAPTDRAINPASGLEMEDNGENDDSRQPPSPLPRPQIPKKHVHARYGVVGAPPNRSSSILMRGTWKRRGGSGATAGPAAPAARRVWDSVSAILSKSLATARERRQGPAGWRRQPIAGGLLGDMAAATSSFLQLPPPLIVSGGTQPSSSPSSLLRVIDPENRNHRAAANKASNCSVCGKLIKKHSERKHLESHLSQAGEFRFQCLLCPMRTMFDDSMKIRHLPNGHKIPKPAEGVHFKDYYVELGVAAKLHDMRSRCFPATMAVRVTK